MWKMYNKKNPINVTNIRIYIKNNVNPKVKIQIMLNKI